MKAALHSRPAMAIEARGVVKVFGDTRAVDGVHLAVPAGSVYGVLGPNGAGRATAIRMFATLLPPDARAAWVFGHDVIPPRPSAIATAACTYPILSTL